MTAYLITPDGAGRMTATSYPTREAAAAAASFSDYLVEGAGDIIWTGRTMVDVFNALTGNRLKKFENRADGARRIMQALPAIARSAGADPIEKAVAARSRKIMSEPTQEDNVSKTSSTGYIEGSAEKRAEEKAAKQQAREAEKAEKAQAAAAAKAAKEQERADAKTAKEQERADAKTAKAQEREAAKAARAAAKQTNGAARKRFGPDARIKMLVSENPKKHGAAAQRFPLYQDGMTVKEALEAGILRADLSWDTKKGFISVEA
jgi:chemotaxis protein histidine kinase CheA